MGGPRTEPVEVADDPQASGGLARRDRCRRQVVDQPRHERPTAEPVPELLPVQKLAAEQLAHRPGYTCVARKAAVRSRILWW